MAMVSPLHKHRLIFLGDESVGKTKIITRFISDIFDPKCEASIGADLRSKTMTVEDRTVRLQILDISGRKFFKSIIDGYIRDSSVAAAIVYDVADRKSFLNISEWIEEGRKVEGAGAARIVVLVGNKIDLVDERQVSTEEGDRKAREFGAIFVETSAKEGFNIKPLFQKIAAAMEGMKALSSMNYRDDIKIVETRRHDGKSRRPIRRYRCYNCGGDGHTVDGCWELLHPTVTETEHGVTGLQTAAHGVDLSDLKNDIKMLINKLNYVLQVQGASGPSTNSGTELQNQEENCHWKTGEWVLCSSSTPEL